MKIALINDTHFGTRSDSQIFTDYFFKFFEEIFYPYLKTNNINTVFHLGDLVDRRKFINFNTLNQVRTRFLEPLEQMGVHTHILLGNHDTYYKNTNELNSLVELLDGKYKNINIIDKPTELWLGNDGFALIPWINKNNNKESMEFLDTTSCPIAVGHFELNGYEVVPGLKHNGGMDDQPLRKFEQVWSGHFHQKSSNNNIHYLGSQYQITFSDLSVKKGFHVFDTETRTLEFIENPFRMFHSINYNDENPDIIEDMINNTDFSQYENGYVKIFVNEKNNPYLFDRFLDNLYDVQVGNVTIIEDLHHDILDDSDVVDMSKDTLSLIIDEIESMEEIKDKDELKKIMKELYMESLSL